MPRKPKETTAAEAVGSVPIPAALLDQLVPGPMSPSDVQALFQSFKQVVIERAMGAEMSHYLGYREGETNHRNGRTGKTALTEDGPLRIVVPRDRDGTFEPILILKHARRCTGFDDKIIAMYARGMTVREIQGFLAEHYGTQVSPESISSVTDEVMAEVTAWQQRPLERLCLVIFFDALLGKIRYGGVVRKKAVYVALGVLPAGTHAVLGLWIEQTEGAKFWRKVFNDFKTCAVQDVLIAVVDGLTSLAAAIATAFPKTTVQTCIVHLLRNSLDYASWNDREKLAAALRRVIYTANAI